MSESTFRLPVILARQIILGRRSLSREEFYDWAWADLGSDGLVGVHEGTVLSAEAANRGLETESWTLDAAEAPRERDWISGQDEVRAEFYFSTLAGAKKAAEKLRQYIEKARNSGSEESSCGLSLGEVEEQPPQDWDAQWKASFLNSPNGVEIEPFWRILPPWLGKTEISSKQQGEEVILRINPGAGFGTGTHETTQLCLSAIAAHLRPVTGGGPKVLDFGSGSGILAIGAACLGAKVDAVEIDPLAIDNALENAKLNQVESLIHFARTLDEIERKSYQMVIANILRPVLLEFADHLVSRLEQGGVLILSGLIESDVPEVSRRFTSLLGSNPEKRESGEWRSLVWKQ